MLNSWVRKPGHVKIMGPWAMHEASLNSDNVLIDTSVIITPVQINRLLWKQNQIIHVKAI